MICENFPYQRKKKYQDKRKRKLTLFVLSIHTTYTYFTKRLPYFMLNYFKKFKPITK